MRHSANSKSSALPPTLAPRLIGREAAAAYCDVSPNTFDDLVKTGTMPPPKIITGRRRAWDRVMLDVAIDALPTVGENITDDTWSDVDAA